MFIHINDYSFIINILVKGKLADRIRILGNVSIVLTLIVYSPERDVGKARISIISTC